jgi:uracil-DNA glycosylase family 4
MPMTIEGIRNPACTLCRMHATADDVCDIGFGPPKATIMVVSKMANSREYQRALEEELTSVGLDVSEIYFTQVIKCKTFEVNASNGEIKRCAAEYLEPEIALLKPKFILTMGNEALLGTTGKSGITKYRGRVIERADGVQVVPTVSPSAVKRNPGQKPAYLADLRLFANKVKGRDVGIPDPKYLSAMTKDDLRKVVKILKMTDEIYIDIETADGEYYEDNSRMISLAATCVVKKPDGTMGRVVFAVPLAHKQSPWKHQWVQILRILGRASKNIRKVVAHNASFDCKWLIWYEMKLYPTFDTMLAIHLLNENVQRGLKPQAMARLGVEPWGIDTGQLDNYPLEDVLHYNVLDTWYMYWVKQQLVEELKADPRAARIFALETMPAQRELINSEIRGIWIDVNRLKERMPIAEKNLLEIEQRIREAAELPDPNDPDWPAKYKQLKSGPKRIPLEENFNASMFARWMLFEWCGLPILERGKEKDDGSPGDPSMAEGVLMAVKDEHPVVPHMLDRVTAQKHISSFFKPYADLYDDDHRIHTTFKLAGTVTGRLSSGKADADKVSGTRGKLRGVNLQQVPRDPFIRGLFGAPPGWTFVESDYSQIELRVAAMLADETNMKHIYATGGDIHLTTAARVSGLPESKVDKETRKKLGKPVNFGFLYGMGWRKFILTAFENYGAVFDEEGAQAARETYFRLYPKLLPWHARQRRLVNEYGRVQSPLGRTRHLPDIYSPDKGVRMEAERQAINSPVQGFASDMAVIAMIQINNEFRQRDIKGYCLGLVHDAINYEIRDDDLRQALPIIKDKMEDMDHVYKQFGVVVDIPIIADVSVGQHWGDKKELTPDQVYDFQMEYKGA